MWSNDKRNASNRNVSATGPPFSMDTDPYTNVCSAPTTRLYSYLAVCAETRIEPTVTFIALDRFAAWHETHATNKTGRHALTYTCSLLFSDLAIVGADGSYREDDVAWTGALSPTSVGTAATTCADWTDGSAAATGAFGYTAARA
jgi:hypothetical protein